VGASVAASIAASVAAAVATVVVGSVARGTAVGATLAGGALHAASNIITAALIPIFFIPIILNLQDSHLDECRC
jgi:hypothetical protein